MSIWSKLIRSKQTKSMGNAVDEEAASVSRNAPNYAMVDVEVGLNDHKIHDIGALRPDGAIYHNASKKELLDFLHNTDYVCGHNIIHHDAKYLFADGECRWILVDTLYVSPLLFPERPYHKLVKNELPQRSTYGKLCQRIPESDR